MMQTVPSVITSVYGTPANAADKLGVTRPAVSYWKAVGWFPARLLPSIWQHARDAGIPLDPADIPILLDAPRGRKKRAVAA